MQTKTRMNTPKLNKQIAERTEIICIIKLLFNLINL